MPETPNPMKMYALAEGANGTVGWLALYPFVPEQEAAVLSLDPKPTKNEFLFESVKARIESGECFQYAVVAAPPFLNRPVIHGIAGQRLLGELYLGGAPPGRPLYWFDLASVGPFLEAIELIGAIFRQHDTPRAETIRRLLEMHGWRRVLDLGLALRVT